MKAKIFTGPELQDIIEAAAERGISPEELIHQAVMDNLVFGSSWANHPSNHPHLRAV